MSMFNTLAKVAIGIAIAKGADALMERGRQGTGRAGQGTVLGGANASLTEARGGGGLEDMIGSVLSGKAGGGSLGGLLDGLTGGRGGAGGGRVGRGGSGGGGLNDLIGAMTGGGGAGGTGRSGQGGGLGDILGQLAGGRGGKSGGLGDLLSGLAGAAGGASGGSFADLLNQALAGGGRAPVEASAGQEAVAALMLRAMIQAAKSDGRLDETEKARILDRLGEVSHEEMEFVNAELAAPVDAEALARQTPPGLAPQVYTMAAMGLVLDERAEAEFLHALASALGIGPDEVNMIHAEIGIGPLYG